MPKKKPSINYTKRDFNALREDLIKYDFELWEKEDCEINRLHSTLLHCGHLCTSFISCPRSNLSNKRLHFSHLYSNKGIRSSFLYYNTLIYKVKLFLFFLANPGQTKLLGILTAMFSRLLLNLVSTCNRLNGQVGILIAQSSGKEAVKTIR